MKNNKRAIFSTLAVASLLSMGVVGAYASVGEAKSTHVGSSSDDSSHPECYDSAKLNDPNDFCFQTIGPWNSEHSSDDEVRAMMSVQRMIESGKTTQEIQRYYPDYTPRGK